MAYPLYNPTNKSKFEGIIQFEGTEYLYELYFIPLHEENKEYLIKKFGQRTWKGEPCLDIDENLIKDYIDNDDVSVFGIVKEKGTNDEASGTIQVYNHCNKRRGLRASQVWINDVCRITTDDSIKSKISPVKVLFYIFEQLTINNLKKAEICLFVDIEKKDILVPQYNKYGYQVIPSDFCPLLGDEYIFMKKEGLQQDEKYINFPFDQNAGTKRTKRKRTIKRKIQTNKTKKYYKL